MDYRSVEGACNDEVKKILTTRFQDMFWKTLIILEIAFPHKKGDGSENEKTFNTIRSQILRTGNDNIRELENIFENYVILKLYEYKKEVNKNIDSEIYDFKQKFLVIKNGGKDGY